MCPEKCIDPFEVEGTIDEDNFFLIRGENRIDDMLIALVEYSICQYGIESKSESIERLIILQEGTQDGTHEGSHEPSSIEGGDILDLSFQIDRRAIRLSSSCSDQLHDSIDGNIDVRDDSWRISIVNMSILGYETDRGSKRRIETLCHFDSEELIELFLMLLAPTPDSLSIDDISRCCECLDTLSYLCIESRGRNMRHLIDDERLIRIREYDLSYCGRKKALIHDKNKHQK